MILSAHTIIFDFDGTLVDSTQIITKILSEVRDEFNLAHIPLAEIQNFKKRSLKEQIKMSGISPLQLPKLVKRIQQEFAKHIDSLDWHPGIEGLLERLDNYGLQLGILTSNKKENVEQFLMMQDVASFDFIYSAKRIFRKDGSLKQILSKYNLNTTEVVYVGDELSDIEACQKVGIPIIAVTWGYDDAEVLKKGKPTDLVSSADELSAALLSLVV